MKYHIIFGIFLQNDKNAVTSNKAIKHVIDQLIVISLSNKC